MAEERSTSAPVARRSVGSVRLFGLPVRLRFPFVLLIFLVVIAGFMQREFPSVTPGQNPAEGLPLMAHAGACVRVMQDGRLLGLLSSGNFSQFLLLRSVGLQLSEG